MGWPVFWLNWMHHQIVSLKHSSSRNQREFCLQWKNISPSSLQQCFANDETSEQLFKCSSSGHQTANERGGSSMLWSFLFQTSAVLGSAVEQNTNCSEPYNIPLGRWPHFLSRGKSRGSRGEQHSWRFPRPCRRYRSCLQNSSYPRTASCSPVRQLWIQP